MNYTIIKDLLDLLQAYEQEQGSGASLSPTTDTTAGFLAWAQQQQQDKVEPVEKSDAANYPDDNQHWPVAVQTGDTDNSSSTMPDHASYAGFGRYGGMPDAANAIGRLVVVLGRYARKYGRLAVSDTPFSTLDDLTFLAGALQHPGVSKMGLIEMNAQEKPAGMEVIRRLLSLGFIEQGAHPEDGRSQAIFCTAAGQAAFQQFFPRLISIGQMVVGDLTLEQQDVLYQLLHQLDVFHLPIYENRRLDDYEGLLTAVAERKN